MPEMLNNVLTWADDLDVQTHLQAERTARLPFIGGHLALMADAHLGMGATVGSVIPTQSAIIPSAVGVDIGCGMIAAELPFTSADLGDNLNNLHRQIAKAVPAGVGKGHERGDDKRPSGSWDHLPPIGGANTVFSYKQEEKVHRQFGTLGSGNHFVEVCLDERDVVWVVLHSGSRGIGNELARTHIDGAKGLMKKMHIALEDPDLAYFVAETPEFDAYIRDMLWAQDYAMGNREVMLNAVLKVLRAWLGKDFKVESRINCHHNYSALENHGKNMWITRKGAIRAREGDRGVIPGSMGTRSYIVSGKGSAASYCSASHGAGRRMSRGEARRTLDQETFVESMEGIAWNRDAKTLLDEDPRSYKDIDAVMASQHDLVAIDHVLHQVLNYKGA